MFRSSTASFPHHRAPAEVTAVVLAAAAVLQACNGMPPARRRPTPAITPDLETLMMSS